MISIALIAAATCWFGGWQLSGQTSPTSDASLKLHVVAVETTTNRVTLLVFCENQSARPVRIKADDLWPENAVSYGWRSKPDSPGQTIKSLPLGPKAKKPMFPEQTVLLLPGHFYGKRITKVLDTTTFNIDDVISGRVTVTVRVSTVPIDSESPVEAVALHCQVRTVLPCPESTLPIPNQ